MGGPFFVPRRKQGEGRHDIPDLDGVLYCSRVLVSAIAEFMQGFRGQTITSSFFHRPDGLLMSIAYFEPAEKAGLIDLDDPVVLAGLKLRPSQVLTHDRERTRALSRRLHLEGSVGLLWPSALEASWINVSLFESRVRSQLRLSEETHPLSLDLPEVLEAARILGVFVSNP